MKEPAPGKDATFSGKPRNPDECVHAHAIYPTKRPCVSILTVVTAADQSIANAATINPIMPTAMIVFVIVSIVASEKL